VTVGRLNLFTALTLVPTHLHNVRLVQEVQEQTLKRARLILLFAGRLDRLTPEERRLHVALERRRTRRVVNTLERPNVPENDFVGIVGRFNQTHHTECDPKFIAVHIDGRAIFDTKLAGAMVQLGKKVYQATFLFKNSVEIDILGHAVRI
jgi:hypothetical protein